MDLGVGSSWRATKMCRTASIGGPCSATPPPVVHTSSHTDARATVKKGRNIKPAQLVASWSPYLQGSTSVIAITSSIDPVHVHLPPVAEPDERYLRCDELLRCFGRFLVLLAMAG